MKNIVYVLIVLSSITNSFCSDLEIYVNQSRGFYDNAFQLYIETNDPNATIKYTTNNSRATQTNGIVYNGPLNITTTSTVRIFAYNATENDEETHTYLFPDDIIAQSYMQDYIKNHSTYGPQLYDALKSLPVVHFVTPFNTINENNQTEGSFEIFTADGSLSEQENCGTKHYGGGSVNGPKKSHRMYFKDIIWSWQFRS